MKHLHSRDRLGRSKALNCAFKSSKGEVVAYIDVNLATDLRHHEELIDAIKEGYDISMGSQTLNDSGVKRSFTRLIASKSFNFLTRRLLKSGIKSHQCGFEVKDNHWFWDTEIVLRT